MVLVMMISMLPMPFAQTIVSAASIGAPSADAFISNMEAESGFWTENASLFNKDYNLSGGIKKALYYGKKEGQKWYIAGKNEDGSLILICDQNNALMTDKQWHSCSYNYQYSDQNPYIPNGYYTETHSFWEWYGNLPEPDDSYETFHVSPGSKYDEDLGEVVAYGKVSDLLPEGTPYFSGTFIPAD